MNNIIPINALMPELPKPKTKPTLKYLKLWIGCLILWNLALTLQISHIPQNPNIPESTPSSQIVGGLDETDIPPDLILEPLED